jgi:hypothetical protein
MTTAARAVLLAAGAGLAAAPRVEGDGPIQDNSFLIEEAYNQERGVVQHIGSFVLGDDGGWGFTFTQEWPVPAQRHQLSYTLNWARVDPDGRDETGFSDVLLNYRWQAVGGGDAPVAFAPRLSVLVPTGDETDLLGEGHTGVQINLPLSVELSSRFVAHANAGATWVPLAKNDVGDEADVFGYSAGGSVIWLARPKFTVMLEAVYARAEEVVGEDVTASASTYLVSPGLRWAIDFDSGLQIVPGIAVPIGVGSSSGEEAVLFYLSFEHPFR